MMKRIVLFLSIVFFAACAGQKNADRNQMKMEYKAYSKGFYQTITVENQIAFVAANKDEKPVAFRLSDADWLSLKTAVKALDLESLQNLKAPTEKRLYDGASIANLKITYKGKTYETKGFDHGFPPTEIEKIVNKILLLAPKKERVKTLK